MDVDNLVVMVNRIGQFFEVLPDKEEGALGVVTHIRKFWEPRMRKALKAHVEQSQGQGIHPFVLDALKKHDTMWS